MQTQRKKWPCIGETFLVSLIGGYLFYLLHTPIPWTLGPLAAVLVWQIMAGREVYWPIGFRNAGLTVIGYSVGATFTMQAAQQILVQFPTMLLVTMLTIGVSMVTALITSRIARISLSSAMMGSIPGGLQNMVVLSEEIPGSDVTIVTFMQTARLLSVVFVVPFLAFHGLSGSTTTSDVTPGRMVEGLQLAQGEWWLFLFVVPIAAFLAKRLHLPNAFMMGPVLVTAVLVVGGHAPYSLPTVFTMLAQLCVGISLGSRIRTSGLDNWRVLVPCTLAGVAIILLVSLFLGWLLTHIQLISLVTGFLSTSPGGMTEMGITAIALGENVSLVFTYQLFRQIAILLVFSPILKWWLMRRLRQ